MGGLGYQVALMFVLAIPIACISWTVTHEELLREFHEWSVQKSKTSAHLPLRKFFYVFTCEYCFSHYVTAGMLVLTRYHLWLPDWRGYMLAEFSLVFVANFYMSLFGELRLEIRHDRVIIAKEERDAPRASDPTPAASQTPVGPGGSS